MKMIRCLALIVLSMACLEASMTHQYAPILEEWSSSDLNPFDELMMSWNAQRPKEGKFLFYLSVKVDRWSPWLLYASWGDSEQSSFSQITQEAPVKIYQDALVVLEGKKATAFQIKIVTEGMASLENIHGLHVFTNNSTTKESQKIDCPHTIYIPVSGISQMKLDHVRHKDLCSPTSTTAVTRYLSNDPAIDPLSFASQVWDSGFDIYGNWVFNTAQASTHLGLKWDCWVERLSSFSEIYHYLEQEIPVVVSVRGPLSGSAQPYSKGHLLAVIGFDSLHQKVICMDPAFSADNETHVTYHLLDFIEAWGRRGNLAYIFNKK